MEKDNEVKIMKLSHSKFANVMNLAIPNGYPVIIEDVDENIDPILDSVLAKATYDAEGRILIKFADKEIDYHKDFRIYLTTKKPNPKYLPEIFIKVTVINFTATFEGLED